jgi:tRNA(Ile2) C34 agmatinyltransferase TiaS
MPNLSIAIDRFVSDKAPSLEPMRDKLQVASTFTVRRDYTATLPRCPECGSPIMPTSGCWLCPTCGYSPCK